MESDNLEPSLLLQMLMNPLTNLLEPPASVVEADLGHFCILDIT